MRVLLTGFTGFIGKAVYKKLVCKKIDLHVISRSLQYSIKNYYLLDILDHRATDLLIRQIKPDILIHLAWDVTHGEFWASFKNIQYADASINLFESFIKSGGKKIIAAGTCAEYLSSDQPIHEDIDIDPKTLTLYGREKRRVSQWLKSNNCNFTWLRIFGVYGEGENLDRLFPSIIRAVKDQKKISLKNPYTFFDYVNVNDLALFIQECLKIEGLSIINIGTGQSYATFDLYQAIKQYKSSGVFIINRTINKPDYNSRIPDCRKLKTLGFQFKFNFSFNE